MIVFGVCGAKREHLPLQFVTNSKLRVLFRKLAAYARQKGAIARRNACSERSLPPRSDLQSRMCRLPRVRDKGVLDGARLTKSLAVELSRWDDRHGHPWN